MINNALLHNVFIALKEKKIKLITAESLTAGMIASEFAKISGASAVLWGGIICYDTQVKEKLLGVQKCTVEKYGVISSKTATEMALGALNHFLQTEQENNCAISVAVTGVAGPDLQEGKLVGTVHIALAFKNNKMKKNKIEIKTNQFNFLGARQEIREATVNQAMQMVLDKIINYKV